MRRVALCVGQRDARLCQLRVELAGGQCGEDGRRQAEADGAAADLGHVCDPARQAGTGLVERGNPRCRGRAVEEPEPDAHHDHAGDESDIARALLQEREHQRADGDEERARGDHDLSSHPVVDRPRDERQHGEAEHDREHRHAGADGRVVEDLLQELRQVQHRGDEGGGRSSRMAMHAPAKRRLRITSPGTSALSPARRSMNGKVNDQHHSDAERRQDAPVRPAPVGCLVESEQQARAARAMSVAIPA